MSPTNDAVHALCELLQQGDEADRCYAARALGAAGSRAAMEPLIQRLRDEDIDVCVDAAEALGRIGDQAALPALLDTLANDPSGEICCAVTRALGQLGGEQALAALRRVAVERPDGLEWEGDWDTWWDVQLEAVKGLGRAGDEGAVVALLQIVDDEQQQDIESDILRALAQIPNLGVSALIERLQNELLPLQQRWRAARALGGARHADYIEQTLGRALRQPAPEIRAAAIDALAQQGGTQYTSAIVLLLRDSDEQVRQAALKALSGLEQRETLPPEQVAALLNDPSSTVRATLYRLLINQPSVTLPGERLYDPLLADLQDTQPETASAACQLLARLGDPAALPSLLQLLEEREGHPMVRRDAAYAVAALGRIDADVVDTLAQAASDPQQPVRLAALSALMQLEQNGRPVEDGAAAPSPLAVVIAAVTGTPAEQPGEDAETATAEPPAPARLRDQQQAAATGESVRFDQAAEVAPGDGDATETVAVSTPPQQPGSVVEPDELAAAGSTLEAIALDNVAQMLQPDPAADTEATDAETEAYLELVEQNKAEIRRMRSSRKIDQRQDVRRLGTRVLAESDRPEAVATLLQALNDDDAVVRREAAESIGTLAQRDRQRPELVDAVGTLITQLALGDLDLRLTCARTLALLGHRAAVAPLLERLQDDECNVRIRTIEALGQLAAGGSNPQQADHMVVREVPPVSIARRLLALLDDPEAGVRLSAARELARLLPGLEQPRLADETIKRIIDSVTQWSGEEARQMGRVLRAYDPALVNQYLLERLRQADNSLQRSVFIEMLEEQFNSSHPKPGVAA